MSQRGRDKLIVDPLKGLFGWLDDARSKTLAPDDAGFTSKLQKIAAGADQKQMPAHQWAGWLKKQGAPTQEMEEIGLFDYLAQKGQKPLSREDLFDFIDKNRKRAKVVNLRTPEAKSLWDEVAPVDDTPTNADAARPTTDINDISTTSEIIAARTNWDDLPQEIQERIGRKVSDRLFARFMGDDGQFLIRDGAETAPGLERFYEAHEREVENFLNFIKSSTGGLFDEMVEVAMDANVGRVADPDQARILAEAEVLDGIQDALMYVRDDDARGAVFGAFIPQYQADDIFGEGVLPDLLTEYFELRVPDYFTHEMQPYVTRNFQGSVGDNLIDDNFVVIGNPEDGYDLVSVGGDEVIEHFDDLNATELGAEQYYADTFDAWGDVVAPGGTRDPSTNPLVDTTEYNRDSYRHPDFSRNNQGYEEALTIFPDDAPWLFDNHFSEVPGQPQLNFWRRMSTHDDGGLQRLQVEETQSNRHAAAGPFHDLIHDDVSRFGVINDKGERVAPKRGYGDHLTESGYTRQLADQEEALRNSAAEEFTKAVRLMDATGLKREIASSYMPLINGTPSEYAKEIYKRDAQKYFDLIDDIKDADPDLAVNVVKQFMAANPPGTVTRTGNNDPFLEVFSTVTRRWDPLDQWFKESEAGQAVQDLIDLDKYRESLRRQINQTPPSNTSLKGDKWVEASIKQTIMDAIRRGDSGIILPSHEQISELWADTDKFGVIYGKSMPKYAKKVAKKYGLDIDVEEVYGGGENISITWESDKAANNAEKIAKGGMDLYKMAPIVPVAGVLTAISSGLAPEEADAGILGRLEKIRAASENAPDQFIKRLVQLNMLNPEATNDARSVAAATTRYRNAMRSSRGFAEREAQAAAGGFDTVFEKTPIPQPKIITPEGLFGEFLYPIQGDKTEVGHLTRVGGLPVDSYAQGGYNFTHGHVPDEMMWMSKEDSMTRSHNKGKYIADQTGQTPVGIFNSMGDESANFSHHLVEPMMQMFRANPRIAKKDIEAFDRELRQGQRSGKAWSRKPWPEWVGLESKYAEDQLLGRGGFEQPHGWQRTAFSTLMGMDKYRKRGFPTYAETLNAVTADRLIGANPGDSGAAIMRPDVTRDVYPNPIAHKSYTHVGPGTGGEQLEMDVPFEIMFPKTMDRLSEVTVNSTKGPRPLTRSEMINSANWGTEFYEKADQQWLDGIMDYITNPENVKKGLKVGLPGVAMTGMFSEDADAGPLKMDYLSRMKRAEQMRNTTDSYTGSTHDISIFDGSLANPQNDFGKGVYSSSSIDDVNHNYAGKGPDLTARIEIEKERIADEVMYDPDILDDYGINMEQWESDPDRYAGVIAEARLVGDAEHGVVYPLKLNTDQYAVIGGDNRTIVPTKDYMAEAADEFDMKDFDTEDEYWDAVSEMAQEIEAWDMEHPYMQIRDSLARQGVPDEYIVSIMGELEPSEIDLTILDEAIRDNVLDAYDPFTGEMMSPGAVSAAVIQDLGYKGIVDNTAGRKFGRHMAGVDGDTTHYITFPDHENTIRSRHAKFDPEQKDVNDPLASIGLPAAGATGLLSMIGSEDAPAMVTSEQSIWEPYQTPESSPEMGARSPTGPGESTMGFPQLLNTMGRGLMADIESMPWFYLTLATTLANMDKTGVKSWGDAVDKFEDKWDTAGGFWDQYLPSEDEAFRDWQPNIWENPEKYDGWETPYYITGPLLNWFL